ncbi:hypothetical protein CN177_23940 [Sinorhizobium meliloti]|nr:hypothetical protein CN219_26825 [Sinorhizobium meliloti]RVI35991.1 hypothetical protein CN197_12520 [Sinorhizobium meliloti]RVI46473.1 hypothetical protein CN196_09965 [Sinorhizobium meliloti]RVJ20317.1 hypothetical protein CN177_23940 [Sinorhizobium meliloti]RVJ94195.1 hypothetical protein CN170_23435 [Sinorhizobium meliloti]
MEERVRMLAEYDSGNWSVSELCRRYGVCRDTFYAWRSRRDSGAADWFMDPSHAPLHCPHRTAEALNEEIVAMRQRFPDLGPRKLLAKLRRQTPEVTWPAASTIGDILKQAGLVAPVKRRRRPIDQRRPYAAVTSVNDEWSTDFKGWFRTADCPPEAAVRIPNQVRRRRRRSGQGGDQHAEAAGHGGHLHLCRAGVAIWKLQPAGRHHGSAPSLLGRRACRIADRRKHDQHVFDDRLHHADGARDQEWHSAGRFRQPGTPARTAAVASAGKCRYGAVAPDRHDDTCDDLRHAPACHDSRRCRRTAGTHGARRDRRPHQFDDPDARRRSCRPLLDRQRKAAGHAPLTRFAAASRCHAGEIDRWRQEEISTAPARPGIAFGADVRSAAWRSDRHADHYFRADASIAASRRDRLLRSPASPAVSPPPRCRRSVPSPGGVSKL